MLTDIEIAQQTKLRPIAEIAEELHICPEELEPYGRFKAKLNDDLFKRLENEPDGKLILVTAINPTPAGEGKTTTTAGLGQAMAKIGKKAVIALHAGRTYRIYMLGFLPGFPYLGGLDSRLFTPRLDTPRTSIPAGSVGIGGQQTGIYPMESPGGWQLIERTPLTLFSPSQPLPYAAGDRIRFVPIGEGEFEAIRRKEEARVHGA